MGFGSMCFSTSPADDYHDPSIILAAKLTQETIEQNDGYWDLETEDIHQKPAFEEETKQSLVPTTADSSNLLSG